MKTALAAGFIALALLGCGEKTQPPPRTPADVLAVVEGLERHHRVSEALLAIESCWNTRAGERTPAAEEGALREKQASLLLNLSRPAEAVKLLEEIRALRSGSNSFLKLLATAYLGAGEPGKAVAAFESLPAALRSSVLLDHGNALAAMGRPEDGAALLAAGLIKDPWSDTGYLSLGRTLSRWGREAAGKMLLERYRGGEPFRRGLEKALQLEFEGEEARGLHWRARAEEERGRLFEAMELENKAIQKNPGLGAAYLDLARLSLFLERPADTIKALKQLPEDPSVLDLLKEAQEQATERSEESFPPGSLERARCQIRARTQKKTLSESVPELLFLVEAFEQHGEKGDARKLSLFLLRLGPGRKDARQALLRVFDRPGDLFIRLWALEPLKGSEGQTS